MSVNQRKSAVSMKKTDPMMFDQIGASHSHHSTTPTKTEHEQDDD